MTEQELLARIAELEEENARLKHKKNKVSLVEEFVDTYPWIRYDRTNVSFMLSKMVRAACFPKEKKERRWRGRARITEYMLETRDMTPEQLELFIMICGKILDVLDKYEILSEEETSDEGND